MVIILKVIKGKNNCLNLQTAQHGGVCMKTAFFFYVSLPSHSIALAHLPCWHVAVPIIPALFLH